MATEARRGGPNFAELQKMWGPIADPSMARNRFIGEQTMLTVAGSNVERILEHAAENLLPEHPTATASAFQTRLSRPISLSNDGGLTEKYSIGWDFEQATGANYLVAYNGIAIQVQRDIMTFYNGTDGFLIPLADYSPSIWSDLTKEALDFALQSPGRLYGQIEDLCEEVRSRVLRLPK